MKHKRLFAELMVAISVAGAGLGPAADVRAAGEAKVAAPRALRRVAALQPSVARPKVTLDAQILQEGEFPSRISGTMRIEGWRVATGGGLHCIYVPFLDSDYGLDRAITRRQEMFADKHGRPAFDGGTTALEMNGNKLDPKAVIRLEGLPALSGDAELDRLIELKFESRIPRLDGSSADEWFFEGYAPRLLTSCPDEAQGAAPRDLPASAVDLDFKIKTPTSWQYLGPGTITGDVAQGTLPGRQLAFALARGMQSLSFKTGNLTVQIYYRSPSFLSVVATIEKALPLLVQMFGELPYPVLTVLETSELQRFGLPGLVTVNKPAQSFFDRLQSDWMNWIHWVVVSQLVKQWYGGVVSASSADDEWLVSGIAEYAILETLMRDPMRFNLFAEDAAGSRWLSFTYLQVSEITAAMMRRYAPFNILTEADLTAKDRRRGQHPLLFIKHAEAMRQMAGAAGENAFFGFMRQLTASHLLATLSPQEFFGDLAKRPSPFAPTTREALQTSLRLWWTKAGWPDFDLEAFKTERLADGRWVAEVRVAQRGEVDFAPLVGIKDESGKWHHVRAEKRPKIPGNDWHAAATMLNRPLVAEADPGHEAYDEDRFDNASEAPGFSFFPGSADTLRDDAYTVVWLPYAFRLPAQPFSLGAQGVVFRYINPGLFLKGEWAPREKLGGAEARQKFIYEPKALTAELNFDQNYDNDRQIEAAVTRAPVLSGEPFTGLSLRSRFKQRVGDPDSRHVSFVVGSSVKLTSGLTQCRFNIGGEFEKTPPQLATGFDYERSFGIAGGDCNLTARTGIGARAFYGVLRKNGEPPDAAFFRVTDVTAARVRIDDPSLPLAIRLASTGADLTLPFYLPLPSDSMILTRQLKWRLFYDVGRALEPVESVYRASGLGFMLPFGGDLAGAGSLSITKLSVLAILYSKVDDGARRKPSLVFDLSGDL